MQYREIQPRGEARGFIDAFWILNDDGRGPREVQRVVPDGRAELILNLGQPFESFEDGEWRTQPQSFVSGQITGPLLLRPTGPSAIMGVRFRPHGAAPLLRLPMDELTGRAVPVADLSPELARELENACESASFARVEAALLGARGEADRLASEAVRRMSAAHGACSVAHVAADLGISSRQLERRFARAVGMSPKLFCRIQRFQRVFQIIEEARPNWVDAAVECGYYDQAHLIRDFMDFSGKTPAVLLTGTDLARHFVRGASHFSNTPAAASA